MEKSRALYVAQLDEQKHMNDNLVADLSNVEQKLQGHQDEWQESNLNQNGRLPVGVTVW